MEQLQPLIDLLGGSKGPLAAVIAWLAAASAALAPFSVWIQHKLADWMNSVAESADEDDDKYLASLFANKAYKLVALLLRFVNIKLPTSADLERAIKHQKEAVAEATAPKQP